jgi:hypothetical protein
MKFQTTAISIRSGLLFALEVSGLCDIQSVVRDRIASNRDDRGQSLRQVGETLDPIPTVNGENARLNINGPTRIGDAS